MKVYIDGNFYEKEDAKVSVFDHGLLYGDGVFEGIRAYNGRVFRLPEHLKRLDESAKAIFLSLPVPLKKIEEAVLESLRVNSLQDAYIRLVITRGIGDLGLDMRKCKKNASLIVIADKIELYPPSFYEKGLDLITSSIRQRTSDQLSPSIKSLNYLPNIMARAEAVRAGAQEAILLSSQGHVTECTGDNIFYILRNRLYTPPVFAGILEGITRGAVMELARENLHLDVVEQLFTVNTLYKADEVFVTGSGAEVVAAVKIDGHPIGNGLPGALTKKIAQEFQNHARSHGTPIYEEVKSR